MMSMAGISANICCQPKHDRPATRTRAHESSVSYQEWRGSMVKGRSQFPGRRPSLDCGCGSQPDYLNTRPSHMLKTRPRDDLDAKTRVPVSRPSRGPS